MSLLLLFSPRTRVRRRRLGLGANLPGVKITKPADSESRVASHQTLPGHLFTSHQSSPYFLRDDAFPYPYGAMATVLTKGSVEDILGKGISGLTPTLQVRERPNRLRAISRPIARGARYTPLACRRGLYIDEIMCRDDFPRFALTFLQPPISAARRSLWRLSCSRGRIVGRSSSRTASTARKPW